MKNTQDVEAGFAGFHIHAVQIERVHHKKILLRAGVNVRQRNGLAHHALCTQHHATTFFRKGFFRMRNHGIPCRLLNSEHRQCGSCQKGSLKYLYAPSQRTVTITPCSPRSTSCWPSFRAATRFAPDEIPTSSASSRAMRRHMA